MTCELVCKMKHSVAFVRKVVFVLVALVSVSTSQRTHARQNSGAREAPSVNIPDQGTVMGKEVFVSRTQRVIEYLGIPYARPPVGALRFAPPSTNPLPSWSGARNATQFGPSCQQVSGRLKLHEKLYLRLLPPDQPDPGTSEDCLLLNIFIPDGNKPPDGWPVLVWFHGGDFNTGSPEIWDASIFVSRQRILVVTVAYRLNILGFFTTNDEETTGNYGMMDQIAALDWIKRYISLFDGAPSNIVIFGHSSGAISVGLHMISPLSKGKFHKAIAISGDASNSVGRPEAEIPVVDIIAEKFGCYRKPIASLMECLRRVDPTILVRESSDIETWGPIVDGDIENVTNPFLLEHPKESLENNRFYSVPLLAGFTSNEQALAFMEAATTTDGKLSKRMFDAMILEESTAAAKMPENTTCEVKPEMLSEAVLFFYRPHPPTKNQTLLRDRYLQMQTEKNYASGLVHLALKVSKQSSAFVYKFDYHSRTQAMTKDVPDWAQVPHMFELPFIWGLPYAGNNIQWNAADKKMTDVMMSMIGAFVRTGNPSLPNVKWDAFTENEPGVLNIGKNIEMSDDSAINYKAMAFWNEYYPTVLEQATNNCCNVSSSAPEMIPISHHFLPCATLLMLTHTCL